MANVNEISVPVRLKVMQDSIANFQKILDNLQPNTNNWRALNKLITSMSTEAQKLQAQLSKPFSSQQQFNSTERTIDKLEEAAARVSIVMQGLKFSDIKLTPEQTQELQKFDDEINKIRESYTKLQESTKAKLLSDTNTADLIGGLKGNVIEKSFSEIETAVDKHIDRLKTQVEEKNKQYNELVSSKQIGESATKLVTGGLSEGSIGSDIFNKYLKNVDGNLTFRGGKGSTKQALLAEIEKMYSIEPGELQAAIEKGLGKSISQININQISGFLGTLGEKSTLFSGLIKRGNRDASNLPVVSSEMEALRSQLREYEAISQEIARLRNTEITPASAQNDAKVAELTGRLHELQGSILSSAAAMGNYKTGADQMRQANTQLRGALQETNAQFLKQQSVINSFNSMKMTVANFMGFYQVLNLTKRAIKDAANHIKELDSVMNKISIVTDMDTSDLWGQIDQYSKMAQTYGTTIKGAYEVSQIYYQQGLDTADVLTLTNETLKLAKVSGLDYASTTDYMTTALRGFKMEMQDAATVVDVYSNLAANTAVSQEELAVAMSKTASSMESVGSSFQETSAMIATMVAVTRESATNIGSALKSIAARYGEMKSDPLAMTDSDGEELVYNKVDAALQSVGITLKDTEGQFRNFTDVITELAEKWNDLESTQQRYIATQFAGNRQQSRFLALVSNKDLLAENISVAENSEDTGTVQALKALDSLESKIEQVRVAYQQFYTTIGVEDVWKSFLDGTKSVVNTLNGMPKLFGKLPVAAISAISIVVSALKNLGFSALSKVAYTLGGALAQGFKGTEPQAQKAGESWFDKLNNAILQKLGVARSTGSQIGQAYTEGINAGYINRGKTITQSQYNQWSGVFSGQMLSGIAPEKRYAAVARSIEKTGVLSNEGLAKIRAGDVSVMQALAGAIQQVGTASEASTGKVMSFLQAHSKGLSTLTAFGHALQIVSLAIDTTTRSGKTASGIMSAFAGSFILVGTAAQLVQQKLNSIPWVAVASAVIMVISGIAQALQANSIEARLEEATSKAEELANKAKELKANYNIINSSIKKLDELEQKRYDSAEAAEEYQTAVDKLADSFPALITGYDESGNVIINMTNLEDTLANARAETARATLEALKAEQTRVKTAAESAHTDTWNAGNKLWTTAHAADDSDYKTVDNWNATEHVLTGKYGEEFRSVNLDNQAAKILQNLAFAAQESRWDDVFNYKAELEDLLDTAGAQLTDGVQTLYDDLFSKMTVERSYPELIKSTDKQLIGAYINQQYGLDKKSAFYNNQGLVGAAQEAIYQKLSNAGVEVTTANIDTAAKELLNNIDEQLDGLTEEKMDEIDNILQHPEKYTRSDLEDKLTEYGVKLDDWVYTIFDNNTISNTSNLKEKVKQLGENGLEEKYVNGLIQFFDSTKEMSLNERNYWTQGLNEAQQLIKSGYNDNGLNFIQNYLGFYNGILSQLDNATRNALIDQIVSNGFTKEGIEKTIKYITDQKLEIDTTPLTNIAEQYIPNYLLAINAATSDLTTNLDDIDSTISDLQNGIKSNKLEKTIAQVEKYTGIKLNRFKDFNQDGEKFVLEYAKLEEVIEALKTKYGEQIQLTTEDISNYRQALTEDTSNIEAAQAILGGKFEDYYKLDENKKWVLKEDYAEGGKDADKLQGVFDEATGELKNALDIYNQYRSIVFEQMKKTAAWKKGDYTSLTTLGLNVADENGQQYYDTKEHAYKRIQELAGGAAWTAEELEQPDLSNAVSTYQKGLSELLTDLSKYGAEYLTKRTSSYEGVAASTVTEIQALAQTDGVIAAIRQYGEAANWTINQINQAIIEAVSPGKFNDVADMIAGRSFKLTDLQSYVEKYKPKGSNKVEDFLTEDNQLGGELGKIYELDQLTGELRLKDKNTSLDSVIAAFTADFDLTEQIVEGTELYKQIKAQWISDTVKELDTDDVGKQMASGISSLSSAKVGTRVDLSKSPELQTKLQELGYNVTDGYYEVVSEYARDSMILQLESTDAEVNATLRPLQEQIKQKRAKGAATQGIMGQTATREAFRNYLQYSKGIAGAATYQDSTIDAFAKLHGYVWDEDLQQYTATLDALTSADKEIQEAIENGASDEYIKQLREKRGELAAHFRKDEKRDALANVLSNYEDAADYIDDLYTQFGEGFSPDDLKKKGVLTEVNGKQVINVEKLQELVDGYDDLFDEVINQIADEYINNAQKAGSLMTQGTTSKTEMDAFQKAYEKVMGEGSVAKFVYDAVTHTMVLDPTQLRSYLTRIAAEKEFGLTPEQQKDWVDSQIEALTTDNLDFSKILDGSATQKDKDTLKRNLKQYFETNSAKLGYMSYMGDLEEWAENRTKSVMDGLSEGGQSAINAIKSTGKELSKEEIEAAYRAQVAPIKAVADSLNELKVNSVVAKNQIEILKTAGFTVDENGVVTAVGDMVKAYKSIYEQMKATGEATTAELNAALGTYLDNRDGEQQAIDALSNASSMTYSQFAEIFTNAGKELTEEMVNQYQASGMIKHLGGNKMMIADFDAFASEMGWSPNSEEYVSAFKSYNDNLIEYNKRIGTNIKAEFDAVSEAKVGDEINLTETISQLDYYAEKEFSELMTAYGATLNNGILTLTESANIPMIAQEVGKIAVQQGGMTKNEFQAMMARLRTQDQSSIDTAFSSILSSYDSISIDLIESLAKSLKVDFTSLIGSKGIFTDTDNNGTYKLDTSQILSYVAWAKQNVSDEVYNQLLNTVASLQDEALSSISTAANYNYNGISSIADMQAFVDKYNQLVDENAQIDIESAFEYDTINNTFKLNNTVLKSYIEQQRSVLEQLGLSGEALDEYIKDQTDTILRESIEIDNFLDASTSKERNDEANKLIQQIRGLSNYQDIQANAIMSAFDLDDATLALEELTHMTQEQIDLIILQILESGGQDAVDLLKQIKPDASPEELEAAFNSQINKLNDAMNQVGDLVAGQFIGTEGKLYEILSDIHAVDDNGVIVEGFRMVEAYARIYAEMKETATSTTADLNNAYVQLLTAQDQESVDLIEALNNASGMTYEAIGQIFTRYGIELEQALLNSEDAGIARVGYNKIAITDFAKFKGYIEQAIGHTIEVGTQEYLDAYSAYVDSQINMRNQGKNNLQTAFDQLKSVTEAKVGDLLNVTYLEDAFDKSTKTDKDTLVQIAEKFGASIKDGILTISKYTDVPGLLQAVAEETGRAGLLIPEQLAELTDAIADMLSNITSLISNGITGTLNNTDALSLQNWAEKQGLQPLEFNETVEGLQLTADSIAMVYAEMKRLNSLQAQSLLSTIIESNDRYSTLASTLQAAAEVTQRIDFTRATITNPRRTVMGDVGANGVALITPVLPDGTELGDDWAKTLATKYANGEINLTTKLQGSDGQELSYTLEDVSRGLYTAENAVQQATSAMQSYNAAAESAAGATEDFTASLDNLAAQSSLMSDIVLNKLTDPDAMNFMSDKLPDNYQVAINAWENASKAINTLTTAGKNGYIGVEDFYNIVNTSAGLLEAAGKEFNIKGMNAADLMEAACQHLKVVDGDLKIDLSSAGLDMVSGVDDLKNNLTDGIHELAAAEVAILDAEIQVLEVLAAMEAMGDMVVDVDNNGISFELNDMFTFDVDGNVEDFTEDMQAFLDQMNEAIATSDDLEKAVKAIQINGTTLYDLFQGTAKDWEKTFGSAEGASKFMQKLSNIDWGTDINTIQTQIVNAMKDLGQNFVIDVGDNGLVGITATGQLFNIDLDDKDVAKQAQQAVNAFRTDHPDFFEGTNLRDNVKQLINELNNPDSNYVQADLQYTLKVITGEIKIEEEKNDKGQKTGKFVGEYAGVKFRADSIGDVEKYIKQAIDLENQGLSKIEFNEETGEVSGTLNVGAARIKVTKNGDKTTIETDEIDGERYNGDTVEGAVKWLAERGYADNKLAGKTWSIDGTFYEVIQDNELGITYTFTRGSDKKNSWLYNGQTFTSYDEMAQYIRDIVPLEQGLSDDWHQKAGTQHNKAGQEVKIWTNGTATIEYNLETGKVTILADGITFKSRAEADEYLAEKAMADQQADGKDHGVFEDGDTTTLKYTSNGNEYEVEYNSTGKVQTKVTMADTGYTFVATSDTELAMGLAAAAAIAKQKAGELPDLDSDQGTVTIHADEEDYEVTIDDTGKVTVKDPQGKIDEALSEELTKKLEQSKIDTNLKNTISTAITEAFTSLKTELENLDTESITTLATALSTVSSAIDTLAKNKGIETFGKSIEKLKTDNFIAVTTAMNDMAKSLQALASAADWVTLGIALALLNAALILVSINSTAFETLRQAVETAATDGNWETLKGNLDSVIEKLKAIKENKDITITVSFDPGELLGNLQQVIDKLNELRAAAGLPPVSGGPEDGGPEDGGPEDGNPDGENPPETSGEKPEVEATAKITDTDTSEVDNGQTTVDNADANVTQAEDGGAGQDLTLEGATAEANNVKVAEGAGDDLTIPGGTVEPDKVETPSTEDELTIKAKIEYENGDLPAAPTIPDAEGKVNWVNGSIPSPPSFSATGYIHWQSAAGGNFVFHKYLKRDKPAVDKPGTKNRQDTVQATGNAFAGGTPTLMGELGPELVVSKGRYGLVGLNGPEFVSLDKDAIVFNHLQTESLMTKGMSKERGRAVTNERNAVAFATGNVNGGPAKASASAALAVLKQLRAMWESLQNASVSDLAGAAGGGGGGGGGSNDDTSTPAEWVALVERWYNLTQEIAKLEKQITHEEELRSKLQGDFSKNGKAYYQSQKRSLQALKDQIQAQEQLNLSRENYFDQRRAALEKTPLGNIYEFDEKGQMKFKDNLNPNKFNGHTNSFDFLQDLYGYDKNGKANYTNKQKYEIMQKAGLGEYMLYDSDGTKINKDDFDDEDEYYKTVTQQVKDRIDDYASATQSLWDEIQTGKDDLLKLQQAENEILQEMRDNQMEVEDKVLEAIEDMKQREIDALQDERDKLEESVGKYIDGLTNALDNEQKMYETQDSQNELDTKKRRLGILQRSGASAADVSALQSEILQAEKDMYFNAQQAQIDAIQEASDLEIARLDSQIAIMQETLDYQKEFGLLWYQVYDVMQGSAEQITTFIMGQNSQFWSQSPLKNATDANDILFQATQWQEYREDISNANDSLVTIATASQREIQEKDYKIFDEAMKKEFGNDYDKKGKYKDLFNEEYANGEHAGDITEVSATVRATYTHDAALAKRKKEAGQYWTHTGPDRYISINDTQHWHYKYKKETIEGVTGYYFTSKTKEDHEWKNEKCTKCGHKKPAPQSSGGGWNGGGSSSSGCGSCSAKCGGNCTDFCQSSCWDSCGASCKSGCGSKNTSGRGKASGGYVTHGTYELGELGTETVLNAQQTRVLRNNILSNRPNSLISLLKTYNEGFSRMGNPLVGTPTTEDNSTNIETVELNMNVQQIANDYDARRAGEQALSEIMRIARKTSAANSIRR